MPMPAAERYYPGTRWTIQDLPEIPVEYRGMRVVLFTELQQEEGTEESPGLLYTYAYPEETMDPINDLFKVEDVYWLS